MTGHVVGDARKRDDETLHADTILAATLRITLAEVRAANTDMAAEISRLRLGLSVLLADPFDTLEVELVDDVVEEVAVVRADDIRILLKGGPSS